MGNANNPGGSEPCPTCGGTGCPVCKGTGVASERVGRWGRGYREDTDETTAVDTGETASTTDRAAAATGERPVSPRTGRRRGGHPLLVVVGAGLLGALLWYVGIAPSPLLGFGLGLLAGVVVVALV